MENLHNDTPNIPAGVFKALRAIRERIGKPRARTAKLYYLKNRNGRERTLVHFALTVILSIVPRETLPDFVRNAEFITSFGQRFGVRACETEELREALRSKRDAIEVLTREIS